MIVVGSRALAVHAAQRRQKFRTPGDLDILCTFAKMQDFMGRNGLKFSKTDDKEHWLVDEPVEFGHIEFHVALSDGAPEGSIAVGQYLAWHRHQNPYMAPETLPVYGRTVEVAGVDILFSMKRSHRFLPRNWEKHIRDYHLLKGWMSGLDAIPEITTVKQAETKTLKTPSLNKTKVDFFDDHVSNRTFEHDQIHEVMAHRERPMFEYIKDDPLTVKCNKEKWLALPQEDKMKCVLEEAYVIALERGIIPMLYEGKRVATNESCLQWSLMRICTTLCSGWFREFAVENYVDIWNTRDKKYGQRFLKAVEEGRIKPLESRSHETPLTM